MKERIHHYARTVLRTTACAVLVAALNPLFAQNPAPNALPAAQTASRISLLNQTLANTTAASPLTAGLLTQRASLLSQLIATDPATALQLALPPETFAQGSTQLSPIPGVTIGAITVNSATSLTVQLTAAADAVTQPSSILATTGSEQTVLPNGLVLQ